MRPYRDSRLTYIVLGLFFLVVLGYAYYAAQGILFGPLISVVSEVEETREPFILVQGQADRIASLSMNGRTISVTEAGVFEEPYLLAPGYNRIVLDAVDLYGRKSNQVIEIIYTGTPFKPIEESSALPIEETSFTNEISASSSETIVQ